MFLEILWNVWNFAAVKHLTDKLHVRIKCQAQWFLILLFAFKLKVSTSWWGFWRVNVYNEIWSKYPKLSLLWKSLLNLFSHLIQTKHIRRLRVFLDSWHLWHCHLQMSIHSVVWPNSFGIVVVVVNEQSLELFIAAEVITVDLFRTKCWIRGQIELHFFL